MSRLLSLAALKGILLALLIHSVTPQGGGGGGGGNGGPGGPPGGPGGPQGDQGGPPGGSGGPPEGPMGSDAQGKGDPNDLPPPPENGTTNGNSFNWQDPDINFTMVCNDLNCIACISPDQCLGCGRFTQMVNGNCEICPEGTYYDARNQRCAQCRANCKTCNGPNEYDCSTCVPGAMMGSDTLKTFEYATTSYCITCSIQNCESCPNYYDCEKCFSGYYYDTQWSQCTKCQVDFCSNCDSDPTTCDQCQVGLYRNTTANECQSVYCKITEWAYVVQVDVPENGTEETIVVTPNNDTTNTTSNSSSQVDPAVNTTSNTTSNTSSNTTQNTTTSNTTQNGTSNKTLRLLQEDHQCFECDSTCIRCSDNNTCLTCMPGYYMNFSQHQYPHGVCQKCDMNCHDCEYRALNCISCQVGLKLMDGRCQQECDEGTYSNDGICEWCPTTCWECNNSSQCTSCVNDLIYDLIDGQCIEKCYKSPHKFAYYEAWVKAAKQSVTEKNIKKGLNPGNYTDTQVSYEMIRLANLWYSFEQYYNFGDLQCAECSKNCSSCLLLSTVCSNCTVGYSLSSDYQCVPECPPGYYDYYDPDHVKTCVACTPPCQTCNRTDCLSCMAPFNLTNGSCLYNGIAAVNNGDCPPGKWQFETICLDSCPYGTVSMNDSHTCVCQPSCGVCDYDILKNQTKCLACLDSQASEYMGFCMPYCPANTFNILEENTYLQDVMAEEQAYEEAYEESEESSGEENEGGRLGPNLFTLTESWTCVEACPYGNLIGFDSEFRLYCRNSCIPLAEVQMGEYCIPQLCDAGSFMNLSLLNDTLMAFQPLTFDKLPNITNMARNMTDQICRPCKQNCWYCKSSDTCDQCSQDSKQIDGECKIECNPWQTPQLSENENQQICADCNEVDNVTCKMCPPSRFIYGNQCPEKCPPDTYKEAVWCQSYYTSSLWWMGYGSPIGYISQQEPKAILWEFYFKEGESIDIQSISCTLHSKLSGEKTSFKFDGLPTKVKKMDKVVQWKILEDSMTQYGDEIESICQSIVTVNNETQTKVQTSASGHVKIIPQLEGSFEINQIDGQTLNLRVKDFSPFLGMTPEEFMAKLDQYYVSPQDQNDYILDESYQGNLYLALNYYLVANVNDDDFIVWQDESGDVADFDLKVSLKNFFNGTQLQFTLWVENDFIWQYYTWNKTITVKTNSNPNVAIKDSVNQVEQASSVKARQQALSNLKLQVSQAYYEQSEECQVGITCINGQCVSGSCSCDKAYVGSRCDKDRSTTQNEVMLILGVLTNGLDKQQSYLTLQQTAQIGTLVTGVTGLHELTIADQGKQIVGKLLRYGSLMDAAGSSNMINLFGNLQHQYDEISAKEGNRRILDDHEEHSPYKQQEQDLDRMFQQILINTYQRMMSENIQYKSTFAKYMQVVITSVNITQLKNEVYMDDHSRFSVDSSAVKMQLVWKNATKAPLFVVSKPKLSWMDQNNLQFSSNNYLQVNISQPHDYASMFIEDLEYTSDPLMITFPVQMEDAQCMYFNHEKMDWSTMSISTTQSGSNLTYCLTHHLSDFALARDIGMMDGGDGGRVGVINFFVTILFYIVFKIFVCMFGEKQVKLDDTPTQGRYPSNITNAQRAEAQGNPHIPVPQNDIQDDKQAAQVGMPEPVLPNNYETLQHQGSGLGSNHEIANQPQTTDTSNPRRLYDFVCCLCPYPKKWTASDHRVNILFLRITTYMFIFSVLISGGDIKKVDLVGQFFGTLIISIIFSYLYAALSLALTKLSIGNGQLFVKLFIMLTCIFHLLIVGIIYKGIKDGHRLEKIHVQNILLQFFLNLGILDFLVEFISKYPGVAILRRMKEFVIMDFADPFVHLLR